MLMPLQKGQVGIRNGGSACPGCNSHEVSACKLLTLQELS